MEKLENALQQEKKLLKDLQEGNVYALETLMMRYEERIFQFILRIVKTVDLAEELTQDVFLKIWEDRERLHEIESIAAWMYTLSRHKAINLLKEWSARTAREERYAMDHEWLVDEGNPLQESDFYCLVDQVVAEMPEKCRQIFTVKRDEGLSNEEIARRFNLSIHTVKNQLKKSYSILRRSMKEQVLLLVFYFFLSR